MKKNITFRLLFLLLATTLLLPKITRSQTFLFKRMKTDAACSDGSNYVLISALRITGVKIGQIYSSSFSFEIVFTYTNFFIGKVNSTGNFYAYQPSLYSSSPNVANNIITNNSSMVPLHNREEGNFKFYNSGTYNGSAQDLGFKQGVTYTDLKSISVFGFDSASLFVNAPCLTRTVGIDTSFVLPITLLNFSAEMKNAAVSLNWTTANEQANKGFWLEKSYDAKNWQNLSWVSTLATNGNSNKFLSYYYTDSYPKKGDNYYRLTQVNSDGTKTKSKIISVLGNNPNGLKTLSVFPNPASGFINIFSNENSGTVHYSMYNYVGRKVLQGNVTNNNFNLNVSALKSGTYILQVGNNKVKISIVR